MAWLVVCGLLTGCAVLLKLSGFDGGLAAVVYLLACRRRGGGGAAAVGGGAAGGSGAGGGDRRRGGGAGGDRRDQRAELLGLVVRDGDLPRAGRLDRLGLALGASLAVLGHVPDRRPCVRPAARAGRVWLAALAGADADLAGCGGAGRARRWELPRALLHPAGAAARGPGRGWSRARARPPVGAGR